MFPKMKVDERNAALKVMLVRSLSHPCLTEWIGFSLFIHACGIVFSCHIVILHEEVSFKRIFGASLVKGVGEGRKTNVGFLN